PEVSGARCLRGCAVSGAALSGGLGGVLLQEVVELPVLDAGDEGVPLGLGEVEDRALGLLGVAHDDGRLTEVLVLDGNVLAIDELDDDPVAENRFLLGHWHTFFVPALSRPRLVRAWPATHRNARPRGGGPGRSQRPGSGSMSSRAAEISRRAWISSAVALPRSISIISMVQMPDSARATRRRGSSAGTFSGRPDAASSSSSVIRSPKSVLTSDSRRERISASASSGSRISPRVARISTSTARCGGSPARGGRRSMLASRRSSSSLTTATTRSILDGK